MIDTYPTERYKNLGPLSDIQLETENNEISTIYKHFCHRAQRSNIETNNDVIRNIADILKGTYSISGRNSDGETFEVIDAFVLPPTHTVYKSGKAVKSLLTPYLATILEENYLCSVYYVKRTGKKKSSTETKLLGYIPCIVGGICCPTSLKPKEMNSLREWKLTLLHGLSDGYFIRNGIPVAIISTVKKSTHMIFTTLSAKTGVTNTRITNVDKGKTSVILLKTGTDIPTVEIYLPHVGIENHYTIFFAFYILYYGREKEFDIENIIDLICSFSPSSNKQLIRAYLLPSREVFRYKACKIYTSEKDDKVRTFSAPSKKNAWKYIHDKLRGSGKAKKYDNQTIHEMVLSELFPSDEQIGKKILGLAHMVNKHVECCIKLRPLDNDEDHGSGKKIDNSSRMIENLVKYLKKSIISDSSEAKKWLIGGNANDKDQSLVETLKVDNENNISSTLNGKITVGASNKNTKFDLRKVHSTVQFGICPTSTSEGKVCGMTLSLSSCTIVSTNRSEDRKIPKTIRKFFLANKFLIFTEKEGYLPLFHKNGGEIFATEKRKGTEFKQIYANEEFCTFFEKLKISLDISEHLFLEKKRDRIVLDFDEEEKECHIKIFNGYFVRMTCRKEIKIFFEYLLNVVNNYCCSRRTKDFSFCLFLNSSIFTLEDQDRHDLLMTVLWFDGKIALKELQKMIQFGNLPYDTCAYFGRNDREIRFFYDSGRMLYPTFVCDDNGDLIIDQLDDGNYLKNNWNNAEDEKYSYSNDKLQDLIRRGAVIYKDIKTLENSFDADSVTECRRITLLRNFLNSLDIENSDTFYFHVDGKYYIEDNSYVKINGKETQLYFKRNREIEGQLVKKIRIDGKKEKIYGYYSVEKTVYRRMNVTVLKKRDDVTQRNGKHLFYIQNEKVQWIYGDITATQDKYLEYMIFAADFSKSDKIPINLKKIGDIYYPIFRNYEYFEDEGFTEFVKENGKIVWKEEETPFSYSIDFEGFTNGFFTPQRSKIDFPVLKTDIHEEFDIEREKLLFDELEKKGENIRECDYLMNIRRKLEHIDILTTSTDTSEIMAVFFDKYHHFRKKSNLYKIWRYLNGIFKFTHCPIDPGSAYSSIANLGISSNYNQGPRHTYQYQMSKQAESLANILYATSFESSLKRMYHNHQRIVESVLSEPMKMVSEPTTQNYFVAICPDSNNPEDTMVISKRMADYILYVKTDVYKFEQDSQKGKIFTFPKNEDGNKKVGKKVNNLEDDGLPKIGSYIEHEDYIIGISSTNSTTRITRDTSSKMKFGGDSTVLQKMIVSKNGKINVSIKTICIENVKNGDKIAATHAQKGTTFIKDIPRFEPRTFEEIKYQEVEKENGEISLELLSPYIGEEAVTQLKSKNLKCRIINDKDMPVVCGGKNDGMQVDIYISSYCFPSRMTLAFDYEMLATKACLLTQKKADGSIFHEAKYEYFENILKENGFDRQGCEFLKQPDGELIIDQTTNKPLRAYVCPCSIQKLRHDSKGKQSRRFFGDYDAVTGQANAGRVNQGGLRFGSMEGDVTICSGASAFHKDRMLYASDLCNVLFCENCGTKSSESDPSKGFCRNCKMHGKLKIFERTRISNVVEQILMVAGIGIDFY